MQSADYPVFEQAFARLCAAFDAPPTQARKDAYWQAFRMASSPEFLRSVDLALTEGDYESMPKPAQLREAMRRRETPRQTSSAQIPNVQEQLCEYVMLKFPVLDDAGNVDPDAALQRALPWTYLYREWRDGDKRCAECTGVAIPARGHREGFRVSVADMRADADLHARVMQRLAR